MAVLTDELRTLGDLLLYEADRCYCRDAVPIKNMSGGSIAAGALRIGHPLKNNAGTWETLDDAAEADVGGLLLENMGEVVADNATSVRKYSVLVRGPAIVNIDAIPTPVADAETAFDKDALITALAALDPPILVHREPVNQEVT